MAGPKDTPKTVADLLQTRMRPEDQKLAGQVRAISTPLTRRDPAKRLAAGCVVRFSYKWHTGARPDEPKDDFKEVFVLHPKWRGRLHGIDLKRVTAAQREVLYAIFDPHVAANVRMLGKPHRLPMVNDILKRFDPSVKILDPMAFYRDFVVPFIRGQDVYRSFFSGRMWSVNVVRPAGPPGAASRIVGNLGRKMTNRVDREALSSITSELGRGPPPEAVLRRAMASKAQLSGRQKPTPLDAARERRRERIAQLAQRLKKPL